MGEYRNVDVDRKDQMAEYMQEIKGKPMNGSTSDDLSLKKDVIDYLRNRQKAAEIESKVNGINVWTLAGAIALTLWQLLDIFEIRSWASPEIPLRVFMTTQALYLLVMFTSSTARRPNDLRFVATSPEMHSPVLPVLAALLLIIPPATYIWKVGSSFCSIFLLIVFILFLLFELTEYIGKFFEDSKGKTNFPKPRFSNSFQTDKWMGLTFSLLLTYSVLDQGVTIVRISESTDLALVKNVLLAIVAYWLVFLVLMRQHRNTVNSWTYQLETEIILGLVSSKSALRRIEHRSLGPRLSEVMNDFFDGLDEKLDRLSKAIEDFKNEAQSINSIPIEYQHERATRIKQNSASASNELDRLLLDHEEYVDYVNKMIERHRILRPKVSMTLQQINLRHKEYFLRTKKLRAEFSGIVDELLSTTSKIE